MTLKLLASQKQRSKKWEEVADVIKRRLDKGEHVFGVNLKSTRGCDDRYAKKTTTTGSKRWAD